LTVLFDFNIVHTEIYTEIRDRKNEKRLDMRVMILYTVKAVTYILSSLKQNLIVAYGSIAQLGEHLPYKQGVIGSIPIAPTIRPGSSVG
jgi:hypothetical protein